MTSAPVPLAMESVHARSETSGFIVRPDGRKVAYIIDGDLTNAKHVFLCFHGMMSNAKFFKGGAPDGCAYISIDRMGYGKSSYVSPSKFSYSDVVDDAGAIVFPTRDCAALIVRASRWLRQSARMNPKISPIVTGRRTPMAHLSTRLPRVSNTVYFVITIVRLTWG